MRLLNKKHIYEDVRIERGVSIVPRNNTNIRIGKYSSINGPNTHIMSFLNDISIGRYCSIAMGVKIMEYNHNSNNLSTARLSKLIYKDALSDYVSKGNIEIGNDVWIGMDSIVLSGVTIGNGAIIAAGSVVTEDVQPFSIVGGVPAKCISLRFCEEIVRELESVAWWDYDLSVLSKCQFDFRQCLNLSSLKDLKSCLDNNE